MKESLRERLKKLAGINKKLIKEQSPWSEDDPFVYGDGPETPEGQIYIDPDNMFGGDSFFIDPGYGGYGSCEDKIYLPLPPNNSSGDFLSYLLGVPEYWDVPFSNFFSRQNSMGSDANFINNSQDIITGFDDQGINTGLCTWLEEGGSGFRIYTSVRLTNWYLDGQNLSSPDVWDAFEDVGNVNVGNGSASDTVNEFLNFITWVGAPQEIIDQMIAQANIDVLGDWLDEYQLIDNVQFYCPYNNESHDAFGGGNTGSCGSYCFCAQPYEGDPVGYNCVVGECVLADDWTTAEYIGVNDDYALDLCVNGTTMENPTGQPIAACEPEIGCMDEQALNFDPEADTPCEDIKNGFPNPLTGEMANGCCDYETGCMDPIAENYNPNALIDNGDCIYIDGCMDSSPGFNPDINGLGSDMDACPFPCENGYAATNFNLYATVPTDTCEYINGCMDPAAINVDPYATVPNNTECIYEGCTDPEASNYDASANQDDGSCLYPGCTDPEADNYDETANANDGSCEYLGCTNPNATNYDVNANVDDGSCEYLGYICPPTDSLAFDGCEPVGQEPGTMFTLQMGPNGDVIEDTMVYATIEECEENCGRDKEKVLCWKCTDTIPYQPETISVWVVTEAQFGLDEQQRMVRKKPDLIGGPVDPGEYDDFVDKEEGCPKGWEIAPVPFWTWEGGPYDTMEGGINNPCTGPDKPDDRPEPWEPEDPILGCTDPMATNYDPDANQDDGSCEYPTVGGPWFCPGDSGNFPWPACCIQSGIVYNGVMNPALGGAFEEFYNTYSGYPTIPWGPGMGGINGVNYFESPIGQQYTNSITCNEQTSCAYNLNSFGTSNCAGFPIDGYNDDITGPDDENPPGMGIAPDKGKVLKEILQRRAGIKK